MSDQNMRYGTIEAQLQADPTDTWVWRFTGRRRDHPAWYCHSTEETVNLAHVAATAAGGVFVTTAALRAALIPAWRSATETHHNALGGNCGAPCEDWLNLFGEALFARLTGAAAAQP